MLRIVTVAITFTGLVVSLWLGLYLVTHNPRRLIAWLTALTLWSIAGLFLNVILALNPPPELAYSSRLLRLFFPFWPLDTLTGPSNAWLQGWSITPGIALWHHVSVLMRPGSLTLWRRVRILVGYLLAGAAILIQANSNLILRAGSGNPLYLSTLEAGPYYLLFGVALLSYTGFSLVNLVRSARATPSIMPRQQLYILASATLVAGLIGPLALAASALSWPVPMVVISFLLLLAVSLIGYGVANYSALMQARTIRRHFFYNALSIALITALYLGAAWAANRIYGLSGNVFLIFVLLAVITHTLADLGRSVLDRFYYQGETVKLRATLRQSFRLAGESPGLDEILNTSLQSLCRSVRATQGLIMLYNEETLEIPAGYRWTDRSDSLALEQSDLQADDVLHLDPGHFPPPFDGITLLLPLYDEMAQFGVILLGHPVNGVHYSAEDAERTLYPADQLAARIVAYRRQQQHLSQVAVLLDKSQKDEWAASPGQIALSDVEDALRNLHDYARLGDSRLGGLKLVKSTLGGGPITHLDLGKALYKILEQAVGKLKPEGEQKGDPPPAVWQSYLILHEAYFRDVPNRDIMSRLYISEGTFNRRRRAALAAIARAISEMEAAV